MYLVLGIYIYKMRPLAQFVRIVCYTALRRPCHQRAAIWRTGYPGAKLVHIGDAEAGGATAALLACGRRGRWRTALDLLSQLEQSGGASAGDYRSALLACRKHKRHKEAADVLERMGVVADTQAYNEVLHLLRLKGQYTAADALWSDMGERGVARNGLSYYHLLHICGELGRWREALALIEQMVAALGEAEMHSGHVLTAMRACARDKRWTEAVDLLRRTPPALIASDAWLGRLCLTACSEAGEPELAAELVRGLGAAATSEQVVCVDQTTSNPQPPPPPSR